MSIQQKHAWIHNTTMLQLTPTKSFIVFNDEPNQFHVFFAHNLLNLMVKTDFQQSKFQFGNKERSGFGTFHKKAGDSYIIGYEKGIP